MVTILFSLLSAIISTSVEVYHFPDVVQRSSDFSVSISGQDVGVLATDEVDMALFGTDGEVAVDVKYLGGGELRYADIRPMEKGYEYELDENTLHLKLKPFDRVSVEINGNVGRPLFIFVNPLEEEHSGNFRNKSGILYFRAGNVYPLKRLDLKDCDGLYIEGGAIVRAALVAEELSGLKVGGCGILDCRKEGGNACRFSGCSKLSVENLCILNCGMAACLMTDCTDVFVKNVKAINVRTTSLNGEKAAFDWAGCKKVSAEHLFAYSQTRALSIHNKYADICQPCEDFHLEDCVAWNVQTSSTLSISGSDDASLCRISVRDFYAIHSAGRPKPYYRAVLSIQQAGTKKVSGLDFTNIVAEDPGEYLFCLSGWITDVNFVKLKAYSAAPCGSMLRGSDFDHRVSNVVFRDFTIGKKTVKTLKQAGVKNPGLGLNIIFEDKKL